MAIEVINSAKQSIDISALTLQEIAVTNIEDAQSVDIISQKSSQIIDVENAQAQEIDVKQDAILVNVYDVPFYEGEYKVTPKFTEQTLPTSHRILDKDMHIEKIPYYEVSNNSGGTTVTIG